MNTNWTKIGSVAVDSGQLVICDPCYIDSFWTKQEYEDVRLFKDVNNNKIFEFRKDFISFEDKLKKYKNKTPNQLLGEGVWIHVEDSVGNMEDFNYNNMSHKGGENHKEIRNGLALCFDSGYGDGLYDVFGKKDENGRIVEVKIKMG